jgi:hypothetical protein
LLQAVHGIFLTNFHAQFMAAGIEAFFHANLACRSVKTHACSKAFLKNLYIQLVKDCLRVGTLSAHKSTRIKNMMFRRVAMKHLDSFSRWAWLVFLGVLFFFGTAWANDGYPVAGLEPSVRPAGAPVITSYPKYAAWYRHALTGVVKPYPASLRFLESQGPWHTPFVRPGMTGPYDIRNWHGSAASGTGQAAEKR